MREIVIRTSNFDETMLTPTLSLIHRMYKTASSKRHTPGVAEGYRVHSDHNPVSYDGDEVCLHAPWLPHIDFALSMSLRHCLTCTCTHMRTIGAIT